MSDRRPIVSAAAPPSYSEARSLPNSLPPTSQSIPADAPPPYTPPKATYSYNHVVTSNGASYQSFDNIVEGSTDVIALVHLGPEPCQVICPHCGQQVITVVDYKAGALTFITAGLCFLFCIVCTFLPFCLEDLQDVAHFCPLCKRRIGTFSRI